MRDNQKNWATALSVVAERIVEARKRLETLHKELVELELNRSARQVEEVLKLIDGDK